MSRPCAGFSMIEMILTLGIMAILFMQLDLRGFAKSKDAVAADALMTDIVSAIALARRFAIAENTMVTFCRSDDGAHCRGEWRDGSIVFTDRNGDRRINGDDRLLFRLEQAGTAGELSFNSFRNRQYLQLTPLGFTNRQNGNFTFCPANGTPDLVRQVIISFNGRTRYAKDSDGDGVVENSGGEAVGCE